MRARLTARRRRRARNLLVAGALLPLLGGCAVVGFPAQPPTPVSNDRPSAARPSTVPAMGSEADLIVRPDPAPVLAPTAPPRSGRREYEVFGERYTVMADAEADNYVEVGIASWYGRELAGRRTSNGEIFDPQALTAAHRTLPMSTWVEVKNLENGRSVVLRVNDRGPFAETDERIIDVSYGAARVLGLVGAGTARVEVRAVPPRGKSNNR